MQVTPSIFKAYDIRGIVPATLNEQVAEGLGKAFGTAARAEGQTTVAVGRDGRLSGPALSAALIRGLVAAGMRVIDIGMATTPTFIVKALQERLAPPTMNIENLDPAVTIDVVRDKPRALPQGDIAALNDSFGFGGHNVVLAFKSY